MTDKQLNNIRGHLLDKIFSDPKLCFNDLIRGEMPACTNCNKCDDWDDNDHSCMDCENSAGDLLAVIASLYNLLHEEVTGQRYGDFFHAIGKTTGGTVDENCFDAIMNREVDSFHDIKWR